MTPPRKSHSQWALSLAGGIALIILAALALRLFTSVQSKPFIWDEEFITAPIFDLIQHGWSVKTALDFKETKGPALIWTYAIVGQVIVAISPTVSVECAPVGPSRRRGRDPLDPRSAR